MFRKRDTDPMEDEIEQDEEAVVDLSQSDEAEPEDESLPDLELRPVSETKPKAETTPQPSKAKTAPEPSDDQARDSELPEIKPLSAAPKSAPASASPTASSSPQANKRLIVGQGIRLSGEINSCDRLVVEGEVEVTLNDTLALEITSSGRFTGGCEVEEADISGIYEGDLTVRNTLFVRGTGRITGTIRYGQLELERGGQIAGNISVLGNESVGSAGDGKVRSAKAPLFGSGS